MLIPLPSGVTVRMSLPALVGLVVLRFLVYAMIVLVPIRVWDVWFGGMVAAGIFAVVGVFIGNVTTTLFMWGGLIHPVCSSCQDHEAG